MLSFRYLLPLLLAGGVAAAPSSLFRRAPDKNSDIAVKDRFQYLAGEYEQARPLPSYRINRWTETIPERCYSEASRERDSKDGQMRCARVEDLNVFEVFYSDSSKPWLFCRCRNEDMSETDLIEKIGRVPPGIRQHTMYIMAFSRDLYGGVADTFGNIIIFGRTTMAVIVHEMAHQIDIIAGTNDLQFSDNPENDEYQQSMRKDTCWATTHARDTWANNNGQLVEAWADTFTLVEIKRQFLPHNTNPANLKVILPDTNCIFGAMVKVALQTWDMISGYNELVHVPYGPKNCRASSCLRDAYKRSELMEPDMPKSLSVMDPEDGPYVCNGSVQTE